MTEATLGIDYTYGFSAGDSEMIPVSTTTLATIYVSHHLSHYVSTLARQHVSTLGTLRHSPTVRHCVSNALTNSMHPLFIFRDHTRSTC